MSSHHCGAIGRTENGGSLRKYTNVNGGPERQIVHLIFRSISLGSVISQLLRHLARLLRHFACYKPARLVIVFDCSRSRMFAQVKKIGGPRPSKCAGTGVAASK